MNSNKMEFSTAKEEYEINKIIFFGLKLEVLSL
jgi:hypothetical protein